MQLRKFAAFAAPISVVLLGAESALAASVLDTTLTTAMSAGFTDMKDTVSAVVAVAFPIAVAIAALLAGVQLVIKMLRKAPK